MAGEPSALAPTVADHFSAPGVPRQLSVPSRHANKRTYLTNTLFTQTFSFRFILFCFGWMKMRATLFFYMLSCLYNCPQALSMTIDCIKGTFHGFFYPVRVLHKFLKRTTVPIDKK